VLGLRSAPQLTFALLRGFRISNEVKEILRRKDFISPATKNQVVRVVSRSVSCLRFPNGADYEHICAAGIMYGLSLCPAEIGPLLRLRWWQSQPLIERKRVRIAMEPIPTSRGKCIFYLSHDSNGFCLDVEEMHPDDFYGPGEHFVFLDLSKLLAPPGA